MHVILKIHVPLLRIKSDYQLMGKVGKELVRGSGRLDGTFSKEILLICRMKSIGSILKYDAGIR